MSRTKGSKNKATLAKQAVMLLAPPIVADTRTDAQILTDIKERFDIYYRMIQGATEQDSINALIVSGSAGVGKSYTAEWALDRAKSARGIRYRIVRGTISAIDLYELAFSMCNRGDIIVLDDCDGIFEFEDGLNILKALLDTSVKRMVNWMTDHPRFKGKNALPKEFEYKGSIIFLTNRNFQTFLDANKGKYIDHFAALMSRSIYLDLKMHSRREVALWARHLVLHNKILRALGLTEKEERLVMDWLVTNMDNLREMSIRTALKIGRLFMMNPANWEPTARILLLKK